MKPINSFYLKIPSRSANESFARFAVSAFVSQLDPTLEELSDIKTAVSEAVTNSIVHAYKNEIGNIYITAEIYENRSVKIRIRDTGCGIDDVNNRPVGNPKRSYDEHSSKSSLSCETKVINPVGESQT